jgi:hypothetical protein
MSKFADKAPYCKGEEERVNRVTGEPYKGDLERCVSATSMRGEVGSSTFVLECRRVMERERGGCQGIGWLV